ncbi:MAG: hypothetical protein BWY70_01121 [Bacteroidetes bacterium ADurb.Bin408]|nr:MAG: hypothetical protein BWY70_01121 [Bacteroidetes bacterium ADurb.Bin408]
MYAIRPKKLRSIIKKSGEINNIRDCNYLKLLLNFHFYLKLFTFT